MRKKILWCSFVVFFLALASGAGTLLYKRDKNKYEPRLWIGFFDYRLNFRDVGSSLNQCLQKESFQTDKVFRSNRYFSGWSCDKIHNPDKIYSLDFSPWNPHAYYCEKPHGGRVYGAHPNTTFEVSDIENFDNWQKPEFKNTMCAFFKDTLQDLRDEKTFLYHCDMGRDRTGTFTAMLVMMLAEQSHLNLSDTANAIECDYEKTTSLEADKKGRMKTFLSHVEKTGGVTQFIKQQCGISSQDIQRASVKFIK